MKPTLICLWVVLPNDTFVLGFHLQSSSGLCQSYRNLIEGEGNKILYHRGGKNVTCPKKHVLLVRRWLRYSRAIRAPRCNDIYKL